MAEHILETFDRLVIGTAWANVEGALPNPDKGSLRLDGDVFRAYHSTAALSAGDKAIRAQTSLAGDGEVGVCFTDGAALPFRYRAIYKVVGTTRTVEIHKNEGAGSPVTDAELASATATEPDAASDYRTLKMTLTGDNGPVKISVFLDDMATPLLTYTDKAPPTFNGALYASIYADATSSVARIDNVTARRMFRAEVQHDWSRATWTWDTLADHAMLRLARGGNPQFSKTLMLEYLSFAEQEFVRVAGEPYWANRVYAMEVAAGATELTLPPWVSRVTAARYKGGSQDYPVEIKHKAGYIYDTTSSSIPTTLYELQADDEGRLKFAIQPGLSEACTIDFYVKAKAGYIRSSDQFPLVPQEFVEGLIFGALKRAMTYDVSDPRPYNENRGLYKDIVAIARRDAARHEHQGSQMVNYKDALKRGLKGV